MNEQKRALISVSDKSGVADFAGALVRLGFEIVSTGGTARFLREAGLAVTDVSGLTGFPEILDGRVKTLHPLIHGAILARLELKEQREELEEFGIVPFKLVVVNLYPFEETVARPGVKLEEAVENIDVGGPAMLRAAAKNHEHVAVVVNPDRYDEIIAELERAEVLKETTRRRLAAEAFAHTAGYDAAIAAYFQALPEVGEGAYPDRLNFSYRKIQDLRYGENPQQKAAFYADGGERRALAAMRQLQGKELSFNNINDLHAARELAFEFECPTVVAVKHANPCGVGSADCAAGAYMLAHDADPVAIFGGVVVLNRPVDGETARRMVEIFLEVVAAPQFTREALDCFARKKDIRLLQLPDAVSADKEARRPEPDLKKVGGGLLVQSQDYEPVDVAAGEVVTERAPTATEWEALSFAQKVVKHVRSNAIVIAGSDRTFGIGAGQMSRIGAARIAIKQAGERARGAALGSDAFFPFPDTVEEAAEAGITAIVQPGGSMKDSESIELCNRLGLTMVMTGKRYFKH